jgi:hypothetical protein
MRDENDAIEHVEVDEAQNVVEADKEAENNDDEIHVEWAGFI